MNKPYQRKNKHVPDTRTDDIMIFRLRDYLEYIEIARNLSPLTIAHTKHVVSRFTARFESRKASSISYDELEHWMIDQANEPSFKGTPKNPTTINTERAIIRAFLRYCRNSGDELTFDPASILNMRTQRKVKHVMTPEDILDVARNIEYDRLRLLILVTFFAGLRIGEAIKIRPRHLSGSTLIIEDTKSLEPRPAFLPDNLANELREYIEANNITDRIFPYGSQIQSLNYERYTTGGARKQIQKHFQRAGYDMNPHDLRHAFATMLRRNGADIYDIKELLGHADVRTTQIYLHIEDYEMAAKHKKYTVGY